MSGSEVVVTLDGLPRPAELLQRDGDQVLVRYRHAGGWQERWVPATAVLEVEQSRTTPPPWKLVGLGVLGLLGLVLLLWPGGSNKPLLSDTPSPSPTPTATATPTPSASPRPTVVTALLLGDSLTAGRGNPPRTATALQVAARQLGWQTTTLAREGVGFTTTPSLAALMLTSSASPRVVLVQAGAADTEVAAGQLRAAATATLQQARRRFPRAVVILVGPVAMGQPVDPSLVRVNTVLGAVAATQHVPYVNVIGSRWITAANTGRYVSAGSYYPDAEGHAFLGAHLAQVLRGLRITA